MGVTPRTPPPWETWAERPVLFRLYDLINEVERPAEEVKQTLIDASNAIIELTREIDELHDCDDDFDDELEDEDD